LITYDEINFTTILFFLLTTFFIADIFFISRPTIRKDNPMLREPTIDDLIRDIEVAEDKSMCDFFLDFPEEPKTFWQEMPLIDFNTFNNH